MTLSFRQRISAALADQQLQRALKIGTQNLITKRQVAMGAFAPMEDMRRQGRQIRAHTLSRLDSYLAQFAAAIEAAGGHVFWAKDAAEANQYVLQLAQTHQVKRVVKAKSMVSEEIGLGPALEAAQIEVIESDLGELIIQLAGETPSHIVAPAMHKTRAEVGHLFQQKLGVPYTDNIAELTQIARAHLRQVFITADMGISGVNFGIADSGSLCIVTNEGNGRLSTTVPRLHVALMGLERLLPTLADAGVLLQLLGRSATGQKLSVYTNIITGPRRPDEEDGPEELHVVILDNGRSRVLASELAEILYCIRCGACLNHCPVYQSIGGHAYGSVYTGPVGSILTPALLGLECWGELPHASSLCGACQEVCPVQIDLPRLLLKLRDEGVQAGQSPLWLKVGLRAFRAIAQQPAFYQWGLRAGQAATRLLAQNGWIQKLPPPLHGWTNHRAFPVMARKSFRQRWIENHTAKKQQ